MLKTNKDMKKLGDFSTRTPKKDSFTEYIYCFADGTRTSILRSDLSKEVDDLMYEELKREANNNEVQIEKHRIFTDQDTILKFQKADLNIEEMIIKKFESDAIAEAIKSLLPQQQELIYRKYVLNKTNLFIAEEDGVLEGAIRNRLRKIHKQLEKKLK